MINSDAEAASPTRVKNRPAVDGGVVVIVPAAESDK